MADRPFEWYSERVQRNKIRGFSLAEIMVTLMLLSVISLVLSGLIPATITGMTKASQRNNAGMLADDRISTLQQSGFGVILPTVAPHEAHEIAGTDYTLKVNVDPAPLSGGGTMDTEVAKLVSVQIDWKDRNGDQKLIRRSVVFKRI
jgi:prepilin-type N-terminal cleavage/methylation domain-containing protein